MTGRPKYYGVFSQQKKDELHGDMDRSINERDKYVRNMDSEKKSVLQGLKCIQNSETLDGNSIKGGSVEFNYSKDVCVTQTEVISEIYVIP